MTHVDQVRTGFGRGQCTEASVASLLDVPLDAVPDLWDPSAPAGAPADVHQPPERRLVLWTWLRERHGVAWTEIHHAEAAPDADHDYAGILRALGLPIGDVVPAWAEHHIIAGNNPDGVGHFVVGRLGRIVHDPNPSRRGLATRDGFVVLVPIDLIPEGWPEPASSWSVTW